MTSASDGDRPIRGPTPDGGPSSRDNAILAGVIILVVTGLGVWVHLANSAVPFVLDEVTYLWQADLLATGRMTAPAPAHPEFVNITFTPIHEGRRFGKYPLGYPLALVPWVFAGIPWGLNVALAGLSLFLLHRFAWMIGGARLAWTSTLFLAVSPFFIAESTIYFNHALVLVLTQLCLAAVASWESGRRTVVAAATASTAIGWAMNISPFVCVPMAAVLLTRAVTVRGGLKCSRWETIALLAPMVAGGLFFCAVNYRMTGDALLTGYTYADARERPGFGDEIGYHGHSVQNAIDLTGKRLRALNRILFGWPYTSLLFAGPYLLWWAARGLSRARGGQPPRASGRATAGNRDWEPTLLVLIVSTLLVYTLWFFHGNGPTWGPRYLYGAMPAFIVFSAMGFLGFVDALRRIAGNGRFGRIVIDILAVSLLVGLTVFGTVPYLEGITQHPVLRLRREIARFVRSLDDRGIDRGTVFVEVASPWGFHSVPAFLYASGLDETRSLVFAMSLGEKENRRFATARGDGPIYYAWLEPDSLRWHLAQEPRSKRRSAGKSVVHSP